MIAHPSCLSEQVLESRDLGPKLIEFDCLGEEALLVRPGAGAAVSAVAQISEAAWLRVARWSRAGWDK